jgi:PKD repeat protein
MAVINARTRFTTAVVGLTVSLFACTVHKTDVPSLSGPSGLGQNIVITVSPDVLPQDGLSQSLVTITATNSNGQPAPNIQLRADIGVGGVSTDFGRLSARSLVTDSNGHASTVYTAPAPVQGVVTVTKVDIDVTPLDGNFDNSTTWAASLKLVPPGVVSTGSSLVPSITVNPASPNAGDPATLIASFTDPSKTGQVPVAYAWDFGDGTTGSAATVTHVFRNPGVNIVRLTITDNLGQLAVATLPVTIGGAVTFSPTFFITPAPTATTPVTGQNVTFNASANTPPVGHTITGYLWDFGDKTDGATGNVVTHTFTTTGTFVVLLRVTLDNGAQATSQQSLTIFPPNPTAVINLNPPTGVAGQLISLIGNNSTPAPGRTLVTYTWSFGDGSGTSGSQSVVTHAYGGKGTYTITLLVTDDQGNQNLATASITIN